MPTAHIYLTDGFDDDQVVVKAEGRVIFEADGVTTSKLRGLAKQLDALAVSSNDVRLSIEMPGRHEVREFDVDLDKGRHVAIALKDGKLQLSVHKRIGFM